MLHQIRLESPRLRHRFIEAMRSIDCEGTLVEDCGVWGVLPDKNNVLRAVVESRVLVAHLPRPLAPFLVTNDFMAQVSGTVDAPDATVPLPADTDPYDGRKWRVQAADADYATAILTPPMWQLLERIGQRRKFLFFVDGRTLAATAGIISGTKPQDACELAEVARLMREQIATGAMDRWVREPDLIPTEWYGKGDCALRGWQVTRVDRHTLFELWKFWPTTDFDLLVEGTLDGTRFRAVRHAVSGKALAEEKWPLDFDVPRNLFTGVVMVPLRHPVPSRVHYARRPVLNRSNVTTEWLDFADDFQVRSGDERVGHEVTTPLLMQYLYDQRVQQLEVRDGWLIARVARFAADDIEKVARTLLGARPHLPGYEISPSTRSR